MLLLDREAQPTSKVMKAYEGTIKKLRYETPYKEIEEAIENLYRVVGAREEDQFFFTSGERENSALVFYGVYFDRIVESGKNFLLAPKTERASLLQTMERLESVGCETIFLPVDSEGRLTVEILEKHFSPKASLLAISWVNPLTGVWQPIPEIAAWCKERAVLLYVEASEIFTKHFFRFQDLPVDFLSFSGEKFHAPTGTGGVFMKKETAVRSTLFPESYEHIPGLIALSAAASEMIEIMDSSLLEVARLRAYFEEKLVEYFPEVVFFGRNAERVATTTAFALPNVHGEALCFCLEERNIRISRGGGSQQWLSCVLETMGVSSSLAIAAVSINFSMMTVQEEVDTLLRVLREIV